MRYDAISPTSDTEPTKPKKTIGILWDADRHQKTPSLSLMPKANKSTSNSDKFRFLTEKSIKVEKFELTRWQSARLRSQLPRGIYWLQIEKSGLVHWNWTLLQSYLLNGGDCAEHRSLVEEYLATLPHTT